MAILKQFCTQKIRRRILFVMTSTPDLILNSNEEVAKILFFTVFCLKLILSLFTMSKRPSRPQNQSSILLSNSENQQLFQYIGNKSVVSMTKVKVHMKMGAYMGLR